MEPLFRGRERETKLQHQGIMGQGLFIIQPIQHKFTLCQWQSTPVFVLGEFHGQKNLVGSSPWGHQESDMTEQLHFHFMQLACLLRSYMETTISPMILCREALLKGMG